MIYDSKVGLNIFFSCLRKKSFTKKAADAVIDNNARKGVLFYYYKCPLCKAYHLTSKPPKDNNIEVV